MKHRAFTLIELLVAISVVALLVSIALPSLSGSVQAARSLKCSTNLRSMATLIIEHAHQRGIPPARITEQPDIGEAFPACAYRGEYSYWAASFFYEPAGYNPRSTAATRMFNRGERFVLWAESGDHQTYLVAWSDGSTMPLPPTE